MKLVLSILALLLVIGHADGLRLRELQSCLYYERLSGDKCVKCPNGQVANADGSGCRYCPSGTVRGAADGSGTGDVGQGTPEGCLPAADFCDYFQRGSSGKCVNCPNGQVAKADYSGCRYCLPGTVRGNRDGSGTDNQDEGDPEGCMQGSTVCKVYERASSGKCVRCPNGQVANDNYSGCEYCPAGSIRGNEHGSGLTGCSPCAPWQRASSGKCVDCPNGQVSNDGATACVYCAAGFVRGNEIGSGESDPVCIAAAGVCDYYQRGSSGKCVNCPNGQVAKADYSGCRYCVSGTVRGNADGSGTENAGDGNPEGCIAATGVCQDNQRGSSGKCVNCPSGQVANEDHTGCVYQ